MKFLNLEGRKVRLQLWDQGNSVNPQSTFNPLFTRHVSGCIVVANTSNPASITKAAQWKEQFDQQTKVYDEPSIPCTLFINHDCEENALDGNKAESRADTQKELSHVTTRLNYNRITEFEELAEKEKNGYFGVYHVTIGQPETIYESFENFTSRMIDEQEYAQRTFTIGSTFFDDYTIKNNI